MDSVIVDGVKLLNPGNCEEDLHLRVAVIKAIESGGDSRAEQYAWSIHKSECSICHDEFNAAMTKFYNGTP